MYKYWHYAASCFLFYILYFLTDRCDAHRMSHEKAVDVIFIKSVLDTFILFVNMRCFRKFSIKLVSVEILRPWFNAA